MYVDKLIKVYMRSTTPAELITEKGPPLIEWLTRVTPHCFQPTVNWRSRTEIWCINARHRSRRYELPEFFSNWHKMSLIMQAQFLHIWFLLRDADMHSAYLLRQCGWLAGCTRHTPVLYQNG